MKKSELIERLSEISGESKAASERVLNAFTEAVTDELSQGGSIALVGFGTFRTSERAARNGRNPQTGESIQIAARTVPSFKAGEGLKTAVNK